MHLYVWEHEYLIFLTFYSEHIKFNYIMNLFCKILEIVGNEHFVPNFEFMWQRIFVE